MKALVEGSAAGMSRLRRAARVALMLPFALGGLALRRHSAVAALNALVPRHGYKRHSDIPYGDGPRHMLDLYVPKGLKDPAPVIVFFYGGTWQSGDREDYLFAAEGLAAEGFVVAVPDYRLWPEVRFPAFVEDGAAALAWVLSRVGEFGGDPSRVHVMGHSAGAHIAAMLALDPRYLSAHGQDRARLAGLIGLAGPYDFLPITGAIPRLVFDAGRADLWPSQPVNFASAEAPPAFLASGETDDTVRPRNTLSLGRRLEEAGARVVTRLYPRTGHVGIVLALARVVPRRPPVLSDIAAFVRGNPARL